MTENQAIPSRFLLDIPKVFDAIERRSPAQLKRILESDPSQVGALFPETRETPLHRAAYLGFLSGMKLLITSGANVNASDFGARTPLHKAALCAHVRAVDLLVSAGAEVNAKDCIDFTPLSNALISGHETRDTTIAALLAKGAEVDVFAALYLNDRARFIALVNGDTQLLSRLAYGPSLPVELVVITKQALWENSFSNRHDPEKFALGKEAVLTHFHEWLEILIDAGCDVNAPSPRTGPRALHQAVSGTEGDPQMVEWLIERGADVNLCDGGLVPLTMARESADIAQDQRSAEIISILIKHGAVEQ